MKKKIKGYIAITSVLVIMAVILIVGTSVSLLSVNDIQSSLSNEKGEQTRHLIEGCIEDVLLRLNNNNSLPTTVTIPEGSCSVTLNSNVGVNWTFTVNATILNYAKSIQVTATRSGSVQVTSWTEL